MIFLAMSACSYCECERTGLRPALLDPVRGRGVAQVFSTWPNSSSTGVPRPKMVTDTRNLLFS